MATDDAPDPQPARRPRSAMIPAVSALFVAWRRAISAVVAAALRLAATTGRLARTWVAQWRRAWDYHSGSDRAWSPGGLPERQTAAAIGVRAFIFGLAIAAVVTSVTSGGAAGPGIMVAMTELLWAAARFIIIALLTPRGAIDRSRLSVAFFAGLLPYAIGATALLRLVALGGSAFLTRRGLIGAGVARRDVHVSVAWAFGGQAGVIVLGWLARAIVALVAGG